VKITRTGKNGGANLGVSGGKARGTVAAKKVSRNGLTVKLDSLEFANCLPKTNQTSKASI
jgi:hypothetical protein